MAMFSSSGSGSERPDRGRGVPEQGLSILAAGLTFTGELETDGVVKIEGTVEGTIRAKGQVLVAKGGMVKGNIHTADAIIGGEVDGEIFAEKRVEMQATAKITGDINTPKITVQDGGMINGSVRMGERKARETAAGKPDQRWSKQEQKASKAPFELESTGTMAGTKRA